jgi:hypothetical protein
MSATSRAHVRRDALAKVRRLDATRAFVRGLAHDERQVAYVELELLLGEEACTDAPAKTSAKGGQGRKHCTVCGDVRHNRRTCPRPPEVSAKAKEGRVKWTDTIEAILRDNPQGLRTYEIATLTKQATPNAFGILQLLLRTGRVERHGERYSTLWTLPGATPEPRIETITAAIVHVLTKAAGPVDARVLHEETAKIIHQAIGKRPQDTSVRTELARLVAKGVVARRGANEHGPLFVLAGERGGLEGAPTVN